jgi:cytochrome b involved in lipid metabolism
MLRITTSELKQHRKRDDCWSAFNGKVYNITSYLPYHPGGEKELLRVAGRDGTQLFSTFHACAFSSLLYLTRHVQCRRMPGSTRTTCSMRV